MKNEPNALKLENLGVMFCGSIPNNKNLVLKIDDDHGSTFNVNAHTLIPSG